MAGIAAEWRDRLLALATRLAPAGGRIYLVGGLVRDLLLGIPPRELDLYLQVNDPPRVVQQVTDLASALGDRLIPLHAEPRILRWVLDRDRWADLHVDRVPIEENLAHRDFTINAMALPWPYRTLDCDCIDPFGGRTDLQRRVLRQVRDEGFREDPLRVLRAYRLAAHLDMALEDRTRALLRGALPDLVRVPAERIMFELLRWFQAAAVNRVFHLADEDGLWPVLFPELAPLYGCPQGGYHHRDVWGHTVEVFTALDDIFRHLLATPFGERFRHWLDGEVFTMQQPRRPFVKLLALLHDVGKPATRRAKRPGVMVFWGHARVGSEMTRRMLERMRCSRRAVQVLAQAVALHLRPLEIFKHTPEPQAPLRLLREFSDLGPWLVLISCADQMGKAGPLMEPGRAERFLNFTRRVLDLYFDPERRALLRMPIGARQIMHHFGVPPGPALGELMRRVRKAWVEGRCETAEAALGLVAQWLGRSRGGRA